MATDIRNREDIALLVNRFYDQVKEDTVIGYLFNDVAKVNWEAHLPVMYDFWESIIFQKPVYSGNPMPVHMALHGKSPLTAEHFSRWKELFLKTVNDLFEGPNAELARQRAVSIATMMQIKTSAHRPPGSLI